MKKALGLTAKQRERWDDAAKEILWNETGEPQRNALRIRAMKVLLDEPEKDAQK